MRRLRVLRCVDIVTQLLTSSLQPFLNRRFSRHGDAELTQSDLLQQH
jgi:hypothetical protein